MQVTREDTSRCIVTLNIEVEAERYTAALAAARKRLGRNTEIPGFRKGKAPMAILERMLDPSRVSDVAGEILMPEAVEEALKEQEIEPWDSPTVEVLEAEDGKPFKFKTTIPLKPFIELGEYKGLEITRLVRPVTDDVVDHELERLQRQHTRMEPREDGPVQDEDYVFVSIQQMDDNGEPQGEPAYNAAVVGENVPDFDAQVKGMAKDEVKDFTINYPEDWQDAEQAGKTVHARVTVSQIYKQIKPELDAEFAKMVGEFADVDALKAHIREQAEQAFTQVADEQVENDILRKLVDNATVEYPPQMMQAEVRSRLRDLFHQLEHRQVTFEQYLEQSGQTEEQFRHALEIRVDTDIKVGLAVGAVADAEKLEVADEEVEAKISEMQEGQEDAPAELGEYLNSDQGRESIRRRALFRKTLEFLKDSSNIKSVTRTDEPGSDTAGESAKEAK